MLFVNYFKDKLSLTGNRAKIFSNVFWAVLGKFANIFSGLFVGVLVARFLGPSDFGLMNYVISYITLFSIISTFGLDNIEIRELSKKNLKQKEVLGTSFCLRFFLALFTCFLVYFTTLSYESDNKTILLIMIYSLSYIFSSLNIIRNYFTSIIQNKFIVKSELLRIFIGGIIKVLLVYFNFDLVYFIWSLVLDFFLISLGYLFSYKGLGYSIFQWKFNFDVAKFLIRESLPLVFSGAAILIYQKIDQLMINNMLDSKEVGLYAVGSKLSEFAIFIPVIISQTVTPLLIKLREEDSLKYNQKTIAYFDIVFWSALLVSVFMFFLAEPIILLMYGDVYLDAVPAFKIMSFKIVFAAMFTSSSQLIIIEGIQKYAVLRNILGCFLNVALNLLLIPLLGIEGSAIVSLFTLLITGYLSHLIIPRYRFIFFIQTDSVFKGIFRVINMLKVMLMKFKNV